MGIGLHRTLRKEEPLLPRAVPNPSYLHLYLHLRGGCGMWVSTIYCVLLRDNLFDYGNVIRPEKCSIEIIYGLHLVIVFQSSSSSLRHDSPATLAKCE